MTDDMNALRDYFDVLIQRWKLVLAMPILAMIAAALVTLTMKPTYEATAIIALAPATLSVPTANQAPPYYLVVDSPRHLPIAYTPAYYVALLKSAEVVNAVAPTVSVTVSPNGSDKSLIEITARGDEPKMVVTTANAWAQAGAARIQQVLFPSGDEAGAAQKNLDVAEQALAKFSQDNALGNYDLTKLRATTALPTDKKLELARLLRTRDVAESVYVDFARDQERATILATNAYRPTMLSASMPTAPISPKPVQDILLGAAFGLLIGILGAFAVEHVSRSG
jgi:capsular polysaccharide biosynthesis protein